MKADLQKEGHSMTAQMKSKGGGHRRGEKVSEEGC